MKEYLHRAGARCGRRSLRRPLTAFDSATPGTVSTIGAVTGLASGDTLVGIDRRPSNGVLYGLAVNFATGTGRVYTSAPRPPSPSRPGLTLLGIGALGLLGSVRRRR